MAGEIQVNSVTALTESGSNIILNNVDTATNRTNLGLGSMATQDATAVSLTGGSITGTEFDLKSTGTSVYKSDGTTAVISESGGTVTVNNATLGSSVVLPTGTVIQTKQLVDTTNRSATNTASFSSIGTELAITPTSSSNKILIIVQATVGSAGANYQMMSLLRDSTDLTPAGVEAMIKERPSSYDPVYTTRCVSFSFLDSPSTTSSVTYKISAKVNTGTMRIGRRGTDTEIDVPTFLTLMEIAG